MLLIPFTLKRIIMEEKVIIRETSTIKRGVMPPKMGKRPPDKGELFRYLFHHTWEVFLLNYKNLLFFLLLGQFFSSNFTDYYYFGFVCAKTVIFRAKQHGNELLQNLIVYFFVPYTFYPSDAPFLRKRSKYEKYPPKGGFPPKKGGSTHLMEGNSLDLCSMTLEESSCQV